MLVLVAVALAAVAAAPTASAQFTPRQGKPTVVKLLSFNDFHGHLEANTPGRINDPVTGVSVPAGGAEYFATHMKALGSEEKDTFVVAAGDMIGATPLLSGLFHDEPTIEFLNLIGTDSVGVGNHEFDEGKNELLRMQFGNQLGGDGCHPVDGCQDGTPFFGSMFGYLAANVVLEGTKNPLLPSYEIFETSAGKIAFIGETLENTPLIVTPSGVAGLDFLDEADTANALIPELRAQRVKTIVLLLHQGGFQNAPYSRGFQDVNACENFRGPELVDVVNRLDPEIDAVVSGHTHAAYVCRINGRLVTGASSFGRLITSVELSINARSGDVVSTSAKNNVVTQTVAKDPAASQLLAHYKGFADPIASRVVGSITGSLLAGRDGGDNAAGESTMGDVIADAQLEATKPADFGGAVVAFMNPGGIRGSLIYTRTDGQPQPVTYGELFTVQPFSNTLVVKTCTGAQIEALLEQQFVVNRILQVSNSFRYSYSASAPVGNKVDPASIKIDGATVVPTSAYRVTMNSFLADGGDGFTVFTQCTNQLGGEVDLDALVRYFEKHSPIAPPPLVRITRLP